MIDLNVIAFDVPFPPIYGGVIDVYFKLKALKEQGVRIALHCFDYGRGESSELDSVVSEVYYYSRKTSIWAAAFTHPYTVKSRNNFQLLENLKKNKAPILFESLLSCAFLNHMDLANRKKFVRTHNIEHNYYDSLATYEGSKLKKLYFQKEARALEYFESTLKNVDGLFCISPKDEAYFKKYEVPTYYLPAFSKDVDTKPIEILDFAMYHGNLAVEENVAAAEFLIEIFKNLPYKLILAGREPSEFLKVKVSSCANIELIENPTEVKLNTLLSSSRVHCLPTFQSTGIKLKLLHALKCGNQILVNSTMVEGTGLAKYCIIADSETEWTEKLKHIFKSEPIQSDIDLRKNAVSGIFDNNLNAKQLVGWLGLAQ